MHRAVKELEQTSAPNIDQLAGRLLPEAAASASPC
jgi:hypothetical protein